MDFSMIMPNISVQTSDLNGYAAKDGNLTPKVEQKAFQEFEALFIQTMLTEMTKGASLELSGKKKSMQEEWTWSMMAQTISQEMARQEDLGLAKMLMENRNHAR